MQSNSNSTIKQQTEKKEKTKEREEKEYEIYEVNATTEIIVCADCCEEINHIDCDYQYDYWIPNIEGENITETLYFCDIRCMNSFNKYYRRLLRTSEFRDVIIKRNDYPILK